MHGIQKKIAIDTLLTHTPKTKIGHVNKIVDKLLGNNKFIDWDSRGRILIPTSLFNDNRINLSKLIKILMYKKHGTPDELAIVYHIIRNFYNDIRCLIVNEKVISQIKLWDVYSKSTSSCRKRKKPYLSLS